MNIFQDYIYIQNNYPKYKNFFRIPEKDLVSLDTRNIFGKDFCFEVSPKNKKIQEYTKLGYKYFISINNSKDLESVKGNIHPHGYIFYLQNNKKFISEIKTFIGNQKQKCFILFSFEKVGDSAIKQLRPTVWDLRRKAKEKKLELDDNFIRIQSAKRNIFILGPKEINLDISEICNAQCIFCYTNGSIFKTEKKKQLHSLTKKNLEFLSFIGVEGISLGITGEPMLDNLQIKRLFQDIDGIDISLSFLTNGYSIIDHIKEIYKNIHIKDFIINIGAGDPKNFLLSRPKDTIINFYKVWKGIALIKKIKPDISLILKYVVTKQNKDGLEKFIEKALKYNITRIDIVPVTTYNFSMNLELSKEEKIDIFGYIEQIKMKFPEGCINHFGEKSWEVEKKGKCYQHLFYNGFHEGKIYGCCRFVFEVGLLEEDLSNSYYKGFKQKNIWQESQDEKKINSLEKCSKCIQYEESKKIEACLNIEEKRHLGAYN